MENTKKIQFFSDFEEQNNTKRYKLVKLSDDEFNGVHPNGINEGYTRVSTVMAIPIIGERFYLNSGFSTSVVLEILSDSEEECTFKTLYSTYKITKATEEDTKNINYYRY